MQNKHLLTIDNKNGKLKSQFVMVVLEALLNTQTHIALLAVINSVSPLPFSVTYYTSSLGGFFLGSGGDIFNKMQTRRPVTVVVGVKFVVTAGFS